MVAKPVVGASEDTWGTILNAALETIEDAANDAQSTANSATASAATAQANATQALSDAAAAQATADAAVGSGVTDALDARLTTAEGDITALETADALLAALTVTDALDTRLDTAEAALLDGGWQTMSLHADVQVASGATAQYKKVGSKVYLRGQIERVDAAQFTAAASTQLTGTSLPVGYRPLKSSRFACATSAATAAARLDVSSAGLVAIVTPSAGGVSIVSLTGISYWLD